MGRYGQRRVLVANAFLTAESRVQAYIDPGATGLFLQGVIGGIAAVIVLTRSWWQRILSRARRSPHHDEPRRGTLTVIADRRKLRQVRQWRSVATRHDGLSSSWACFELVAHGAQREAPSPERLVQGRSRLRTP